MTQEQVYDVVSKESSFELRRYAAHTVAEVEMTGSFEHAGNAGFRPLVSYISGRNTSSTKVAMTAPVIQRPSDEPFKHRVAFVMPEGSSVGELPTPVDGHVSVHEVAEELAAASTFSGRWTEDAFLTHVDELRVAVAKAGLTVAGPARYARFDPPWKPWFMRRNEVVLPVQRVD